MILCGVFYLSANEQRDSKEVVTEHFSDKIEKQQTTSEPQIYIHICGAVKKPGVYIFDKEPRIIEVVQQAGGFTKKADKAAMNLAQIVSDGTKLEVKRKGKKADKSNQKKAEPNHSDGKVDLNTATKEELMTINGIGESKASQIISYRETYGGFQKIEDIMNISGIKEGIFSKIKDSITVS